MNNNDSNASNEDTETKVKVNIEVLDDKKRERIYPRPLTQIAEQHESRALTMSSLSINITLLTSMLYKEKSIYKLQIFMIMICSTLFWMKPRQGLRRTCDITLARVAVVTSIYSSFHSDLQKEFLINLSLCLLSFLKAVSQWEKYERNWYLWHMLFHILGNTSNIILQHGRWLQRNRLLLN